MKKQIFVSVDRAEVRVALLEAAGTPAKSGSRSRQKKRLPTGYHVAELYLERRNDRSLVGNIYKGVVHNVLPGLEAAFVDIGLEKNGFLHVDEIVVNGGRVQEKGTRRGEKTSPKIADLLKPGQEVVVQIVKDPLKTKGARVSMQLAIPGRYMVYTPFGGGVGISRRLPDKERVRLRKELTGFQVERGGIIVRTASEGAKQADFERELPYLLKLYEVLERRVKESQAPALVFQEPDLPVRVVRDIFSAEFERAVVDNQQQYDRLTGFFARTAPELVERVELWGDQEPLFEAHDIEPIIDGLMERRVDLSSGGYLMIDYAEALTVIDVNSGSFTGKGRDARLEETITKTNLEAAEEVVRQLRLRDIGGIVVIDFIDMASAKNRNAVLRTLRRALERDRTKTYTAEISSLGLVEMTRQTVTEGVRETMTRPCPTCDGDGVIKSEETIAIDVERKLHDLAREEHQHQAFLVRVHPRVGAEFTADDAHLLHLLERETGKAFFLEGTERLALDHFSVTLAGTEEEVMQRAVPFASGDEVLVQIVEPHMYRAGDAVAKVDGYVISIAGGGKHVGQQRMVRIQEVMRMSAHAQLIDIETENDVQSSAH